MTQPRILAEFDGPMVMIGFGTIGTGALPLILRHIGFDHAELTIVAADDENRAIAEAHGIRFVHQRLTADNLRTVIAPLLNGGGRRGFCVNLSIDVSSMGLMELCKDVGALYLDTVAEPWLGYYTDTSMSVADRSNYALRETLLDLRRRRPGGPTAVTGCGANPGMVSWLTKQALVDLAGRFGLDAAVPAEREDWARLAMRLGVKGIHIAERDTQVAKFPKPQDVFVNTWSIEGLIAEGLQPAELGWGTHERHMPLEGRRHTYGCDASIYLLRPGAATLVRTWTPSIGPQHGFLITHDESITIADYLTLREDGRVVYRPTCHFAYHPCNDALLSLHELAGRQWKPQETWRILRADEILSGMDELGVLLYGHAGNAYWYGSQLSIEEARDLAPYQNATALQVTSAALAGMVWALENPEAGIVEPEEMDFARCLEIQRPYLGPVIGAYTDWTPLDGRRTLFPEDIDEDDPWQFKNVIVR